MRRESIVDRVARQRQSTNEHRNSNGTDNGRDRGGDTTGNSDDTPERAETTYRAKREHLDRLDRAAAELGLPSRNAVLTFFTKQKLDELGIE